MKYTQKCKITHWKENIGDHFSFLTLVHYLLQTLPHMQHHSIQILTSSDKIYPSLYCTLFKLTFYTTELTQLMK